MTVSAVARQAVRPTRVLVVDDHGLVRDALKAHLENHARDFQVVGLACDAACAIRMACDLRPDTILMDISMPGLSCFDAMEVMRVRVPDAKIILVSAHDNDLHIEQALRCEVDGFVSKQEAVGSLLEALQTVRDGRVYFSPKIMSRLRISSAGPTLAYTLRTPLNSISPRERELLRLLARGTSVKDAARILGVSYKTADKQKSSIMDKLDIHDRVALARLAIREGLVEA